MRGYIHSIFHGAIIYSILLCAKHYIGAGITESLPEKNLLGNPLPVRWIFSCQRWWVMDLPHREWVGTREGLHDHQDVWLWKVKCDLWKHCYILGCENEDPDQRNKDNNIYFFIIGTSYSFFIKSSTTCILWVNSNHLPSTAYWMAPNWSLDPIFL